VTVTWSSFLSYISSLSCIFSLSSQELLGLLGLLSSFVRESQSFPILMVIGKRSSIFSDEIYGRSYSSSTATPCVSPSKAIDLYVFGKHVAMGSTSNRSPYLEFMAFRNALVLLKRRLKIESSSSQSALRSLEVEIIIHSSST
jgi:hypothetical protein